jgi:3-hydroxyacyl-CoA dehydrogenase
VNYAASVIPEIVDEILSIDNANRWGFMHELGPFERWDALGVRQSVSRMQAEGMQVTPWVLEMLEAGIESFYQREGGRWSATTTAPQAFRSAGSAAISIPPSSSRD